MAPVGDELAGVGYYTFYLLKHLLRVDTENEYVIFCDRSAVNRLKRECIGPRENVTLRTIPFLSMKKRMPFVYTHMFVSNVIARERLDLLHAPANIMPLFYKRAAVVTVHDLAAYEHPEWFPGELPGSQTFSTRIAVPHSLEAARRIIAVSETTKQDLGRVFGVDERKVDVVFEGSEEIAPAKDAEARVQSHGLVPGEYLMFVGTLEPRKNIPTAIASFVRAVRQGWVPETANLVLAGAHGWKDEPILEAIREAQKKLGESRVRHLGYVCHRDKVSLMANARAFLFPSLYEGFGLPVIEAMRLGVPVIASNVASLPEVCGDAAVMCEPYDVDGFAEAIRDIYADDELYRRLSAAGRKRGSMFTWDKAARETLEVYKKAVGE